MPENRKFVQKWSKLHIISKRLYISAVKYGNLHLRNLKSGKMLNPQC